MSSAIIRTLWFAGVLVFMFRESQSATAGRRTTFSTSQNTGSFSSGKGKKVMEPAFEHAGQTPGLEIWRIENFKPVPYPKKDYGKFFTGDSYIVLFTKEKNGVFSWDVHFWLGKETSQDESGAAAILTVQLDDQLGGGPVQHREVQNHETQVFLSHFKSGIRYAPGGVASGFNQVNRDEFETRLFHVKGKRNVRVKQVDVTIGSMNKGDCFILDVGKTIYVYVGPSAKGVEKLKAISAANQIRDQDHSGRGKVIILDSSALSSEYDDFFEALGGGNADDVPDDSASSSDDEFEVDVEKGTTLSKVSDSTGKLTIDAIGTKPLLQSMLDSNDCFILETGGANIYVWVGKKCNAKEKSEAMTKAGQFMETKNYPAWTRVQRIVENAEPTSFKQYFQTWKSATETYSRLIRSIDDEPQAKLELKSSGEAPEFMPDDGSGTVEIFRVENFELADVAKENYGKFFGGDSYVIRYNYDGNNWIIYFWQGDDSSIDEKASSAFHAVRLDNELNGKATQIRVVQGYEPKHFLHIFKGKLIIFMGGHESGFKNIKEHDTYVENETRLYKIRGTSDVDVRAVQLPANSSSLESDDVFIVENDANTWIWYGKESNDIEKNLSANFLELLAPGSSHVDINEGDEPDEFWEALGGKTEYKQSFTDDLKPLSTTLYHAAIKSGRKLKIEEIDDFTQEDLVEDDVMILDAINQVYIWSGKDSTLEEREQTYNYVLEYLAKNHRQGTIVFTIKQDSETEAFKNLFPSWNDEPENTVANTFAALKQKFQEEE
ncbi:gelsolin, cytoplasmic [Onthophagus taurus]|uniref:gelsolin, cytoplasmic n=1 Tax=Onthophagus taurus TaxID=166361 RepID=UPI000C20588D|nr:gelsolin, cytoplasmic [Onthophagus taurus]